jgi:hypothetical protein
MIDQIKKLKRNEAGTKSQTVQAILITSLGDF